MFLTRSDFIYNNSLSAYLAEIKGDVKYKNAAIASATWIKTQTLGSNNIVLDSVSGANCARSPNTWIFTYNSGKFIEGLSVLADITKDDQWKKLYIWTLFCVL